MERRPAYDGEMDQKKTKSLFLKICGDPATDSSSQEGLRCARGLAVDGRWAVTVELCGEGLRHSGSWEEAPPVYGLTSLQELAATAQIIVVQKDSDKGDPVPEWILKVTPDEALQRGMSADAVLMF